MIAEPETDNRHQGMAVRSRVLPAALLGVLLWLLAGDLVQGWVEDLTLPLRGFATGTSAVLLDAAGVPFHRDGNLIQLADGMLLQVADACSGIRSLGALVFLGLALGFAGGGGPRRAGILAACAVPVAVAGNVLRLTGTAGLAAWGHTAWAQGYYHSLSGWMSFLPALAVIVVVDRAIEARARRAMGDMTRIRAENSGSCPRRPHCPAY